MSEHEKTPQPDILIPYGGHAEQFVEVFRPRTAPLGAVMNIHGGFWRARHDLVHARPLCQALAADGFVVFNVEYRRTKDGLAGWPGTFDDVRTAFHVIADTLPSFGSDRSALAAVGHSAGGHLALLLGGHEPGANVISLAGIASLQRAYELRLGEDAVIEFMGDEPSAEPGLYDEADPMKKTSSARQWLIHGSADDVVPISISRDYEAHKKRRGETVTFVELDAVDHFQLIDPASEAYPVLVQVIRAALS